MDADQVKYFVEAALLAAGRPLNVDQLQKLFEEDSAPGKADIRQAIAALRDDYDGRGIEVAEVASGFRTQVRIGMTERLQKLWEERPPRYSRALFETLALIAYRQPITRGEIEEIRGVSVSTNIIRSLLEREWVRIVGHRDVPGRPAMFGTTKLFLDYFGLKKLEDLPPLADLSDWESLRVQLNLPAVDEDDESDEAPATAEVTDIPVLYAQRPDAAPGGEEPDLLQDAGASDEPAPAGDAGEDFEPIEATRWPDPKEDPHIAADGGDGDRDDADDSPVSDADQSLGGT